MATRREQAGSVLTPRRGEGGFLKVSPPCAPHSGFRQEAPLGPCRSGILPAYGEVAPGPSMPGVSRKGLKAIREGDTCDPESHPSDTGAGLTLSRGQLWPGSLGWGACVGRHVGVWVDPQARAFKQAPGTRRHWTAGCGLCLCPLGSSQAGTPACLHPLTSTHCSVLSSWRDLHGQGNAQDLS